MNRHIKILLFIFGIIAGPFLAQTDVYGQIDTSKIKIRSNEYLEYTFQQRQCYSDRDTVLSDSVVGEIIEVFYPVIKHPNLALSKFMNDTIQKIIRVDELNNPSRKLATKWICIDDKPAELYTSYTIEFVNSKYLSLTISSDWYASGGANGSSHDLTALSFDLERSKILTLQDVTRKNTDSTVYNIVISQIKSERPDLFDQWGETNNPNLFHFTSTLNYPIVVKDDRVIIYWYIGWGGRGGDEGINLYFDKHSDIFDKAFLMAIRKK